MQRRIHLVNISFLNTLKYNLKTINDSVFINTFNIFLSTFASLESNDIIKVSLKSI